MAIGVRLRRPGSGAVILDTNDYTMSVFFKTVVTIYGSGSIEVTGVNLNDFIPVIIPYTYPEHARFDNNGNLIPSPDAQCYLPRISISGNSIVWTVGYHWEPRPYIIMLVRYR